MADLVITRVFNAPKEKVWQAWTDPELLKKWWGPRGFSCPVAEIDFRVGGKYLLCMRGAVLGQAEVDNWSTGTYKEIIPMEKIVVTDSFSDEKGNIVPASNYGLPESFPLESTVEITFEELDGKTKMSVHYLSIEGIEGKTLDDMTAGWNECLDKMEESLNG
jgi:uncharacterized protein YndB with AHSA1/START domain